MDAQPPGRERTAQSKDEDCPTPQSTLTNCMRYRRLHDLIDGDLRTPARGGISGRRDVLADAGPREPVLNDCKHHNGCNAGEHSSTDHKPIIWFRWWAPVLLWKSSVVFRL
jgi:hypothetical protein